MRSQAFIFLDGTAALQVEIEERGSLKLHRCLSYLADGELVVERMTRGYAQLDTGTTREPSGRRNFVRTLSDQRLKVCKQVALMRWRLWLD
jgi:dTDP-glucose pyrophosphorylase